jgi:hypothetical protein
MRLVANCAAIPLLVIVHIGAIALLARFLVFRNRSDVNGHA